MVPLISDNENTDVDYMKKMLNMYFKDVFYVSLHYIYSNLKY